MGKYNLLHEKWISVMINSGGETQNVSILDLFKNASDYRSISGDMIAQDFSVMRMLLAIIHTVFSRFDATGNKYDYVEIDDRFRQIDDIDDFDLDDYQEDLMKTWKSIWECGKFPPIIKEYLLKWEDRFYLYDDDYPFYQVREVDLRQEVLSKSKPTVVTGKGINRRISESDKKTALFSPKSSEGSGKEELENHEAARWLIMYQGYTGFADKVIFGTEKYKVSKGWNYDLGGIFLEGENLFQTLMLNAVFVPDNNQYIVNKQNPCWEKSPQEVIDKLFRNNRPNNISELYTSWSRAIRIIKSSDETKVFKMNIVKLPDLDHSDQFLEPMTLWGYNKDKKNKFKYTPLKHKPEQSLWRNFGLITIENKSENNVKPGVMKWLDAVKDVINVENIGFKAVSLQDDGKPETRLPVDEISDELYINEVVAVDSKDHGWLIRINEIIGLTKKIIENNYRGFIRDIKEIRNVETEDFINKEISRMYSIIDQPFKSWISSIEPFDNKEETIIRWKNNLYSYIIESANAFVQSSNNRDLVGIEVDGRIKNIITAYNSFVRKLVKELK